MGPNSPPWLTPLPPPAGGHPPRRSNTGLIVGLIVVVGLIGVVGMAGLVAVANRPDGPSSTASRGDGPTPSLPPLPTSAAPQTTAPDLPTTVHTVPNVPSMTTRARPVPQKVNRLGDNPLFGVAGLAPTECALPRFGADPGVQAAYYQAALDCMNRAWLPRLAAANLPAAPPQVQVPTGPYPTPCGNKNASSNANYCEGVIYMPPQYFRDVEGADPSQVWIYFGVLAHEYGHHVQEQSGVMDAAWAQRYEAGISSPAGLEIARRNELGATCFGGMFMAAIAGRGTITSQFADKVGRDQARRGDYPEKGMPPDHGTPKNNGAWFNHGFTRNSVAQCNTWLAPADSVS